jgi:hypothetical protein
MERVDDDSNSVIQTTPSDEVVLTKSGFVRLSCAGGKLACFVNGYSPVGGTSES